MERFVVGMYVTKLALDVEEEFHDGSPTRQHYSRLVNRIHAFAKSSEYNRYIVNEQTDGTVLLPDYSFALSKQWMVNSKERFRLVHFAIVEMLLFLLDVEYTVDPPFVHHQHSTVISPHPQPGWQNSDLKLWWYIQRQLCRSIDIQIDFRPLCLNKPVIKK